MWTSYVNIFIVYYLRQRSFLSSIVLYLCWFLSKSKSIDAIVFTLSAFYLIYVLVTVQFLDGKRLPTVYAFALVENTRKFSDTRLLRVRLYLAGEFLNFNTDDVRSCPRLFNMRSHICETERQLYFMKVTCGMNLILYSYQRREKLYLRSFWNNKLCVFAYLGGLPSMTDRLCYSFINGVRIFYYCFLNRNGSHKLSWPLRKCDKSCRYAVYLPLLVSIWLYEL